MGRSKGASHWARVLASTGRGSRIACFATALKAKLARRLQYALGSRPSVPGGSMSRRLSPVARHGRPQTRPSGALTAPLNFRSSALPPSAGPTVWILWVGGSKVITLVAPLGSAYILPSSARTVEPHLVP